ncbi:MAG: thioredoxin fold domain-containing protein [Bacilli bacterium]|nr:thioredoxin fold domain-containing protein [Bacilli bacterium]MDD4282204.1 thioredoxin fold domain-containing protein [Bacilli bacterium]MDD4718203.1 thioredoxin fold domain-containing protein [Bacilli bacterium]
MKKIIIVILVSILFVGCSNAKPYTEIKYKEFTEKIENKETFIFYIGSNDCIYCERYEKALKRAVDKYEVEVFYIDVAQGKLTETENKNFENLINYSGTPTTVFIKDGEVQSRYNRIEGAASTDKIIEAFERNGYID